MRSTSSPLANNSDRIVQPLWQMLWLLAALLMGATPVPAAAQPAADRSFASVSNPGGPEEFLPVEAAYRLQVALLDGQPLLRWSIADGYYLYRDQLEFRWLDPRLSEAAAPAWQPRPELPPGTVKEDPYFGTVETYYHELSLQLARLPGAGMLGITYQGCADGGLCYPPQTAWYRVDPDTGLVERSTAPAGAHSQDRPGPQRPVSAASLALMALLAALGGVVLNLMPCVFPVLSLKVLSFAEDREHALSGHGLSYAAGVVFSFVAIAVAMLILSSAGRSVGWGFQLQSPLFIGLLAYLFLALALSLSGFWSFGNRWMGVGQGLTTRRGYGGSFFTGVLAVIVASPCTAPFMGTALGFASTQPPLPALSVFAALGAGMALPVLLLCLFPGWLRRLPKPGAWMERIKQLLAFPLYATAVWLAWVLGRQAGVNAMAMLLGGAVLLALALWLWRFGLAARSVAAAALAVALGLLSSPLLNPSSVSNSAAAVTFGTTTAPRTYSAETLAELRAAGRPVFLNVTADWCLTCLANERVALSSRAVAQAFAQAGVVYLKADWTRYDPAITRLLAEHGRNGVPLYLYFPPHAEAQILPQLLSPQRVIDAITARPGEIREISSI